ncbi:MAG: hypothetical protein AAGD25_37865 [Cyanobacteria bacterium P01_F01_bin.150]
MTISQKIAYKKTISNLLSLPKYGNGIGLHRFYVLAEMWNIDLNFFKSRTIHVTGSNGKGSVSKFTDNLLQGAGLNVGLFTSPHILRFNERIRYNGCEISDEELIYYSSSALEIRDKYESIYIGDTVGAFEIFTLIATKYFYEKEIDVLVAEAGIGGRFDTTKCFGGYFAALVSLDYEHTKLLGNTLEEIGYEKSDVVNSESTLVLGNFTQKITRKLEAYNRSKGTKTLLFGKDFEVHSIAGEGNARKICIKLYDQLVEGYLSLAGSFQEHNVGVAVALSLSWLMKNHKDKVSHYINTAEESLANTEWHGRLETISSSPNITIDVGHSPGAITVALKSYAELNNIDLDSKDFGILVVGVSRNKKVREILQILSPKFSHIICTRAYHMGEDPKVIALHVREENKTATIKVMSTIEESVNYSIKVSKDCGKPIYVAGGLFLAVEYWQAFKNNSPQDLIFF